MAYVCDFHVLIDCQSVLWWYQGSTVDCSLLCERQVQVRGSGPVQRDAVFLGRWLQTFDAESHGRRQAS